jgi:hypothetical protein
MDWNHAKDAILGFLGVGVCTILIYEMHALRTSVNDLNEKIAVILERTTSHEHRISKLEATHDS